MMPGNYIFISYSRQDEIFALKLKNDLLKYGGNVWLDQHNIPDGSSWDIEIENALEGASYIIVIVSEKSNKSNNVRKEIAYAIAEGKQLLPVRIEPCKLILQLANFHSINMIDDYDSGLIRLLATLNLNPSFAQNKEEAWWKYVLQVNTEQEYRNYLLQYPDGSYKREAIKALSKRYETIIGNKANFNSPQSGNPEYKEMNVKEPVITATSGASSEPVKKTTYKLGENDPCPCGSGRKYKNCHGKAEV